MIFDKLSIGVDIEDISRFINKPYNENKSFYHKIFSDKEIEYSLSKQNPYQHFAARFCAKEAFIKAMNEALGQHKSIEIDLTESKPFIVWHDKRFLVSISHEKDKAIAFVIVSREAS